MDKFIYKMKNQLFTVALILMSVFSQAQKIKVKKNQILVDEKAIAKIDDKKRIYTVSTLNDEPKFTAEVKSKRFSDGSTSTWILISDINNQNTNEIPFDLIFSGLAFEKNIIGNLLKENLPLLSLDGVNETVLNTFLSDKSERISVKMEQKELDIVEKIRQARELYVSKKTAVDKAGNIFCNNVRVGSIARSVEKDALGKDNFSYKVLDVKNILIGEYYTFGGINPETKFYLREELLLMKTKVVPIVFQSILSGTSLDKDKNVENILAAVFFNGYELGNQASEVINEIRANKK